MYLCNLLILKCLFFYFSFLNFIVFKFGDILKIICVFKFIGKKKIVFYGDGINDEMCFGFLMYYLK